MKRICTCFLLLFISQTTILHVQTDIIAARTDISGSNGMVFHSIDQTIFARDQNCPSP